MLKKTIHESRNKKMEKNKIIAGVFSMLMFAIQVDAQDIQQPGIKSETSFAMVIDSDTYSVVKDEIKAYKEVVEKDGLGTYILVHTWSSPAEIKEQLEKLYRQRTAKLEGAVLIGDIPIPMIRDAQFLTSAFKMNQRLRWDKSSVPSDRYYDDFDLQFDFLHQDTAKGREQYFYYSLNAASNQFIEMDIYSARIKPPVEKGEDAKIKIKEYLQKVVRLRREENPLTDMVVSKGHGYNSNSTNAVSGEALALRSQFPTLFKPGHSVKFINYRNADLIKFNLLSELKRPGVDFAYMTGHGTATLQLLNGYPDASAPQPSMENVGRYIRSKMRAAKERGAGLEEEKERYKQMFGLNDKWFEDTFDAASIEADSLFNEDMDMQIYDVRDAGIQARLVYLNSCLTGSFQLDNYLAGYYPFSQNENLAAVANSVGVLQDLWGGELLGVLQHGVRAGNWLKHVAYLETHVLGDPTFSFSSPKKNDLNKALVLRTQDKKYWQSLLKEEDADLQALALIYLSRILPQKEASSLLKSYYFNSFYETVRMEAFQLLRNFEDQNYFDVLHAAKGDAYEYIRRRAVYDLADFGGDDFVKDQLEFFVSDPHSERVAYRARWNLRFLNPELARQYVEEIIRNNDRLSHSDSLANKLLRDIDMYSKSTEKSATILADKSKPEKERIAEITTMRLYRNHALIPSLITIAKDTTESDETRKTALEVMGWFTISVRRADIIAACEAVMNEEQHSDEIRQEALKTKKRLTSRQHS